MYCKQCGSEVPAADVNLDSAIAKCRKCNAVFSFAGDLGVGRGDAVRRRDRADVPQPAGITVEDWGGNLRFVRRWFSGLFIFLAFFCVVWDSFLIFWYSVAFGEDTPLIMKIFPIGHVAVGIGLTYYTLAGFLNRTVIEVGGGSLRIRHAPLPWPGQCDLLTSEVKQLYCQERVTHGKHGTPHYSYHLHAVTERGRKVKLLSNLKDVDEALYLEQEVERRLGIKDRHVPGEVDK